MSRILLIHPHRMLQQAITLALFPEHDVQISAEIPAPSEAEKFDLAIIDVSSSPEQARAIASWPTPVILIGLGDGVAGQTKRNEIVSIEKPWTKQSLQDGGAA